MFFLMSKEKILKGIEQHMVNAYCCRVDIELDPNIPFDKKKNTIENLKHQYDHLLKIRGELKELLIGN